MELKKLRCPTCGVDVEVSRIDFTKKIGRCHACYGTFVIEQAENFAVDVDEIRASRITSLRQNLERAVKKDDGQEMLLYSGKIREMLPDDYEANYFYAYAKAKAGDSRYLYEFYQDDEKDRTPDSENIIVDHVIEHGDFRDKKRIEEFLRGLKSEDEEEFLTRLEKTFAERLKKEEYYDDVERDVFVCYSSIRQDVADRVVNILEKDGNTCWIASRNLRPNDNENYWKDIGKAIRSCRIFLVISSDEAQQSKDVKREIGLAEELQKRRIEIKIDDVPHTTLFKRFFDGCKWVNGENYDEIKTRVADLVAKAMRGDNGVIVRKVEKVKYAPIREAEQPTAKIVLDEFHKHEFVKGEVVPPTCKEPGFTVYRCECGEMKKSDFTARRTEHDFVLAEKKEPTCTDDGYVKYECKYCDATKTDAIPALGHDFKLKEVKDSTCIKKGYRFFTCGRCGEKKWEELPLIGHTFSDWKITKFPSCEEAGEETRQCSFCGKTESRALQPTGHNYGKWITKKEPTCTENGIKVCRCQTCGKAEESEIAAKGHTFGDWYTLPTDVTKDERICKECGYSETRLKTDVKEKKLHVWSLVLVVFSLACLVGMIICWGVFIFDGYHYLSALPITLGALAVVSSVAVFIVHNRKKVANKLIKIGSVFLLVVTVGLTVGVGVHTAVTEKADYYKKFFLAETDNGYEIKRLRTNIDQGIEIPSEIKGKPVVSIADNAFSDYSSLTSITIPDSVTSIGDYAFDDCSSLTSITIPDSVTSIGYRAFSGCSSLQSITIPFVGNRAGVTNSDTYQYPFGYIFGTSSYTGGTATTQYYYGSSTTSTTNTTYYIPSTLKSVTVTGGHIPYGAFYNCSNLTSITLGNSVTSIGDDAFSYCRSLTSITLGNSVTSIGDEAFRGCRSLTRITIPDSVTSIGYDAFSSCSSLTSITLGNGVTSIEWSAFYNCSSLTSVYYTGDIASWCGITFFSGYYDCHSNPLYYAHNLYIDNELIKEIVIPNTVTEIKARAFYGWNGTSITIPASVTSIGEYAFDNCYSLTSVYYTGDITSWCGITFGNYDSNPLPYAHNLYIDNELIKDIVIPDTVTEIGYQFVGWNGTSITIPASVTSIGDYAFDDCSSLTSVTIGSSVTSIGEKAFYYCSSLTSITFLGTKAQWYAISKGSDWNYNTGRYTVHCTDGYIYK